MDSNLTEVVAEARLEESTRREIEGTAGAEIVKKAAGNRSRAIRLSFEFALYRAAVLRLASGARETAGRAGSISTL
jgi:hypothetical protein